MCLLPVKFTLLNFGLLFFTFALLVQALRNKCESRMNMQTTMSFSQLLTHHAAYGQGVSCNLICHKW